MWITSSIATVKTPTIIALGNFDGVHRGHQRVIEPVLAPVRNAAKVLAGVSSATYADQASFLPEGSPIPTVVSFCPHPQEFFTGQRRLMLTPIEEKAQCLCSLGIQQFVLLPFDTHLASLTPQAFVEEILIQGLQAQQISVGQDFRFGKQRSGTVADLQAIAAQHGIPVEVATLHLQDGERISSSAIRAALSQGEVEQANQLLGQPYQLIGSVVTGRQLGRTIGFPTANLQVPVDKFLPRCGVYSVWVGLPEGGHQPGVMNIGYRPTVEGEQLTVEIHLFDWSGDLYGHTLTVSPDGFLRPEQKFAGLEELKSQIQRDCEQAQTRLAASPISAISFAASS